MQILLKAEWRRIVRKIIEFSMRRTNIDQKEWKFYLLLRILILLWRHTLRNALNTGSIVHCACTSVCTTLRNISFLCKCKYDNIFMWALNKSCQPWESNSILDFALLHCNHNCYMKSPHFQTKLDSNSSRHLQRIMIDIDEPASWRSYIKVAIAN